jgi:hypothetical protein
MGNVLIGGGLAILAGVIGAYVQYRLAKPAQEAQLAASERHARLTTFSEQRLSAYLAFRTAARSFWRTRFGSPQSRTEHLRTAYDTLGVLWLVGDSMALNTAADMYEMMKAEDRALQEYRKIRDADDGESADSEGQPVPIYRRKRDDAELLALDDKFVALELQFLNGVREEVGVTADLGLPPNPSVPEAVPG